MMQYQTLESVAQTIGINMLQIRLHELKGLLEEAEKIRSFNAATVEFMEGLIKDYIGEKNE
jgi:predicted ATP-grasp superfamily ATP-dependent carboligase